MKVVNGKSVEYDSDAEFYSRQAGGAHPHDGNMIVRGRIAEALNLLMLGGGLDNTDKAVERLDPGYSANVRFVDVGCRDGWSLEYLASGCRRGFWGKRKRFGDVCGLELSAETVGYAQSQGRNVVQADIRKDVVKEGCFDVVFSRHCLEHLDKPLDALKNMSRMLRPGGEMLVIVPNETWDIDPERSLHSYVFRETDSLSMLVEAAGLKVTLSFGRDEYYYRKRKYWYRLFPKRRHATAELWVFATKD